MRYKRNEGFRFEFGQPLEGRFYIDRVDGEKVSSSLGAVYILDMSLNGMKLATQLHIPEGYDDVFLIIQFTLNGRSYQTPGQIVWKKNRLKEWHYGVQLDLDKETRQSLLDDLKAVARTEIE